jgi:hypothetical protein
VLMLLNALPRIRPDVELMLLYKNALDTLRALRAAAGVDEQLYLTLITGSRRLLEKVQYESRGVVPQWHVEYRLERIAAMLEENFFSFFNCIPGVLHYAAAEDQFRLSIRFDEAVPDALLEQVELLVQTAMDVRVERFRTLQGFEVLVHLPGIMTAGIQASGAPEQAVTLVLKSRFRGVPLERRFVYYVPIKSRGLFDE